MDILKKTIIFSLILFSLGEIIRFQFGDVAIKPLDVMTGALVFIWLFRKKFNLKDLRKHFLLRPLVLFWFAALISLLVNIHNLTGQQFFISFLYLLRWVFYSLILFVVGDLKEKRKFMAQLLLVAGGAVVVLGYIQLLFYNDLRNLYYLGWDEHLYRMFSTFLDPNYAGVFFVLYFLFVLGILIQKKKKYLFVILALTLGAVYLTYSRSALVSLFIGVFTMLSLSKKLKWMVVVIGISAGAFIIFSKNFYIENLNLLRTASSVSRLDSASNALRIIHDQPFFGIGFDTYRYAQVRYGFRKESTPVVSHADAGTDNSFLFILATTGFIGTLTYAYIWYTIFKKRWTNPIIISSVLAFFVGSFFINSLFYPGLMFWMWVVIGSFTENT